MQIKILGSGCANCKKLEANAKEAVKELGVEAEVIKVEDFKDIMKYGVMRTPAIVINEKVKMFGKVCTVEEIKNYIKDEMK
ncbi:thioredoxin family protein [Thermobrachium celere]|uniref:Redox-active disulfide protein 2 n=1 Tax=Thermobrachium celere DSM 8682 TaxID=941824 RepID=R7RSX4_9CLOT|nr:thioredoxin family protein [Thermobrachium celere]GFR34828.1 thioredoxin family protein [Thermobrachium celere]CDF58388.1 redox-active disulfide protein 2 [Thermobrachium celere DSM 8682]